MEKYRRDKKGNKNNVEIKCGDLDLQHAIGEYLESQRENNKENESDLIGEDNPADWDPTSK